MRRASSIIFAVALVVGVSLVTATPGEATASGYCAQARSGDFNGDGYADAAVGAPNEDVGSVSNAGAVNVIYGSATGLDAAAGPGNQLWTQNSNDGTAVADSAETNDHFGACVAAGDFNGDGDDDLAIGVPDEGIGGNNNKGAVNVLYGSDVSGLTATGNQLWNQDSPDVDGVAEGNDRFGFALASGDLNGDGEDDLAIGVPDEDEGSILRSGAVNVIYGSGVGLSATAARTDQIWTQNSAGILDTAEQDDNFGIALATGDIDANGADDLAIGASGEKVGSIAGAGAVNVIYASEPNGLSEVNDQFWHQNVDGVLDTSETGDAFGRSVIIGDFNDNGFRDLAIGVPGEDIGGDSNTGAVNVLYGSATRLTASGDQFWTQDSASITDDADAGDGFGSSLTTGDFELDGDDDLVVGVPGEDFGAGVVGAVHVIYGDPTGLTATGNETFAQDSGSGGALTADDGEETGDAFGSAVTAGDYDGTGDADVVVGVPGEDTASGAVDVIYGAGAGGLTNAGDQFFQQGAGGILGSFETGDAFGSAVG